MHRKPEAVIRAPDIWELFDTDPDLHGGFTDVSGYIRAVDREMHAYVFWREFTPDSVQEQSAPVRSELCSAPFYEITNLLKAAKSHAWLLQYKDKRVWDRLEGHQIRAGMTLMIHRNVGGYDQQIGWTGQRGGNFDIHPATQFPNSMPSEQNAQSHTWETIETHTSNVSRELERLLRHFVMDARWHSALASAAVWHDKGKEHPKWQHAVLNIARPPDGMPGPWAKFVSSRQFRPGIRHECASALMARTKWIGEPVSGLSALAIYLIAAHHGKVRMSLRSIDDKATDERSAFGIRESDGYDLECMEMGLLNRGGSLQPSWAEMVLDVLGPCDPTAPTAAFRQENAAEVYGLGPFRLAWIEMLLRVADRRGSAK